MRRTVHSLFFSGITIHRGWIGLAVFAFSFSPCFGLQQRLENVGDRTSYAFDLEQLSGADPVLGNHAAGKLLQAISAGSNTETGKKHVKFLNDSLSPEVLKKAWHSLKNGTADERSQSATQFLTAQRIVEAITIETKTSETMFRPSFPVDKMLLALVGSGPEPFRLSVVSSLQTLIQRADATFAKTIVDALGGRIQHNRPPPPAVLEDASSILWKTRGRELISFIIGGMSLNRVKAPPWVVDHVVLGHARPKLLRTYMPTLPLDEARDALDQWAKLVGRILAGTKARA